MIAEIIESTTESFTAETVRYNEIPDFGSFVRVVDGDKRIYAIVSGAHTGSLEGVGKARAFFKTFAELRYEQPQIFSLLKSEFTAVVIGHMENNKYYSFYPPVHAKLHLFVENCEKNEVLKITGNSFFLQKTIECKHSDGEELTAAVLRKAAILHDNPRDFLLKNGRELLKILAYDSQRLKSIFERVDLI